MDNRMPEVGRVARAIRTEMRNQGVLWEDEPFDPNQLMMQTGACADLDAIARAALSTMDNRSPDGVELRGEVRNILYRNLPNEVDANICRAIADEFMLLVSDRSGERAMTEKCTIGGRCDCADCWPEAAEWLNRPIPQWRREMPTIADRSRAPKGELK